MPNTRKQYSAAFKAQVVLEALKETKTVAQLASEHQIHPNLLTKWKQEAIADLALVFERKNSQAKAQEAQKQKVEQLYQEIGRLTTQVNWLKKNLVSNLTLNERLALVEREERHSMPLLWQADLLSVARSSLYYEPRPAREAEIAIKHRLDEWYTHRPSLGTRKLVTLLAQEGIIVGRHTIRRYRVEMGLFTLYSAPNLSKPSGPDHKVYPYLLRGLCIDRPNQVWGVDITYIRLRGGFLYLVAFLDWFSRLVVSWELSETLEIPFVLSCTAASLKNAVPEIVNSDQGSHFTSEQFTSQFLTAGARVSMDGRGRYVNNIFTERLWRSVKQEEVYLAHYETPREARQGLASYLKFYNEVRPHQSLGNLTPAIVHAEPHRLLRK
ncbi:IS3 family transposase [Capsulimonas corticalis]